jgi:hypothetical protein
VVERETPVRAESREWRERDNEIASIAVEWWISS